MTPEQAFERWWGEQTLKGDPARRLHLVKDAFMAGVERGKIVEGGCKHPRGRTWEDSGGRHTVCEACGARWDVSPACTHQFPMPIF